MSTEETKEYIERARALPLTYWRIFKTWLPLGMTQFLMAAEDPLYVAVIMRLSFPKLELGALYSYMWPILLLISSAAFTLNTVGNVFGTNLANLRKIKLLAFLLGLFCTLLMSLVAFTPVGPFFLSQVMAIPDSELAMAMGALKIGTIYPLAIAINLVFQGVLIRGGYAIQILVSRVIRFAVGLILLIVGLETQMAGGAVLGCLAVVVSLLAQVVYVWWKSRVCSRQLQEGPLEETVVTARNLIKFTIPLAITPICGSIIGLVMAAALGRLPGVVISLAVWPVITNFNNIGLGMGESFDQVTVKHYSTHRDSDMLRRFGIILGLLLTGLTVLFIVSGFFHFALRTLENLDVATADISTNAMWFLTAMPFLYTMASYYSGLLAKSMHTIPILVAQAFSLAIVSVMLLATVNLEPFLGVYVVAASSVVAGIVSVLWMNHCWRKVLHGLPAED